MIQFHQFQDGGFVLHKIMIEGRKHSAWFNAEGELLDAEWLRGERSRAVRKPSILAELKRLGRRCKNADLATLFRRF